MYCAEMGPNHFRTGTIELPGHLLQFLRKRLNYPARTRLCPAGKRGIKASNLPSVKKKSGRQAFHDSKDWTPHS
jgi:hypothetical protein